MSDINIVTSYSEDEYIENIITQAANIGAVIVCQSNLTVEEICAIAKSMKLEIKEPIPIQWFKSYENMLITTRTPVILYKPMSIIRHLMDSTGKAPKFQQTKSDGAFHTFKKRK